MLANIDLLTKRGIILAVCMMNCLQSSMMHLSIRSFLNTDVRGLPSTKASIAYGKYSVCWCSKLNQSVNKHDVDIASPLSLQWRHNGHDGVSNHQPTIVYSTVYSGADQRKHQSSAWLAFARGVHRWPVNSPCKGPVRRKMFPFDDVIMFPAYSIPHRPGYDLWCRVCFSLIYCLSCRHK